MSGAISVNGSVQISIDAFIDEMNGEKILRLSMLYLSYMYGEMKAYYYARASHVIYMIILSVQMNSLFLEHACEFGQT